MLSFGVSTALLGLIAWGTSRLIQYIIDVNTSYRRYPPGPKPKPFIGNALDIPLADAGIKYMEWGKQYNSGVLHLESLGNHIIILNTVEDADELLERRAKNYSDRPVIPITKLMGWDDMMSLLMHDDKWRLHRRICQQYFRKQATHNYYPLQVRKAHEMLRGLLDSPEKFDDHSRMLSIAIPLSSMYGYEAKSLDDRCIRVADESLATGTALVSLGANYVDVFPLLGKIPAWVPGARSIKTAEYVKKLTEEVKGIPMEHARKRFAEGTAIPSLVTDMLEKEFADNLSLEEEEAVQSIAFTVYGGASDTTISATKSFFYYMATHPIIQKKAQDEIDRIIGSSRLPDFSDRGSGKLPYVEAIYREVLRIAAPLPVCVPHAVSEDDYYKGYFIPKGAIVIANIWAMTHDETRYPDPYAFKPERFLDEFERINDDNRVLAYGFGRRICPGKYIGSSTMWLIIVSVLACFNIEKSKDENGNYIEINEDFEEFGLMRHKAHYQCSIKVRSAKARELILLTSTRHER